MQFDIYSLEKGPVLILKAGCAAKAGVARLFWDKVVGACMRRADDVQVEFVMLDPYVRAELQHNDQVRHVAWSQ